MSLGELQNLLSFAGMLVSLGFYPLSAARLRDLNFPRWAANTLAFPLIGVIILPMLCFLSGSRWENDYGEHPARSGWIKRVLALSLFFAAMSLTYDALRQFYLVRYMLTHGVR